VVNVHIARMAIYQLAIPFRMPFSHGSSERRVSDNVVLAIELGNGQIGYGETLAREYVTGETRATVVQSIQRVFLPLLMSIRPETFGQLMAALETLPVTDGDRPLYAARCAVELALLDVYGKQLGRDPTALAGWVDQPRWEPPGSTRTVGYSGVIGFTCPARVHRIARLWRMLGVRDLKIKVGDADEFDRVHAVTKRFSRPVQTGKVRLRVDANGAWSANGLAEKIDRLEELGILYLEQPTSRHEDAAWVPVQYESGLSLIADESLVSFDDAERLAADRRVGVFNIRIAKNGGLVPALRLAGFAHSKGIAVQLGCMVGETGILTRAGQWLAGMVRDLLFVEGNYGMFLLKGDIVKRRERFRFRGRIPVPAGSGLAVRVDPEKLKRYSVSQPIVINV